MSGFYHVVTRTARKEHRCDICTGTIPVGTRYRESRAVHDGRWSTSKAHLVCAEWWSDVGDYSDWVWTGDWMRCAEGVWEEHGHTAPANIHDLERIGDPLEWRAKGVAP